MVPSEHMLKYIGKCMKIDHAYENSVFKHRTDVSTWIKRLSDKSGFAGNPTSRAGCHSALHSASESSRVRSNIPICAGPCFERPCFEM